MLKPVRAFGRDDIPITRRRLFKIVVWCDQFYRNTAGSERLFGLRAPREPDPTHQPATRLTTGFSSSSLRPAPREAAQAVPEALLHHR